MALATGSTLGSYQIVSLRDSGGMGEVYRARDTKLGRAVAIKILPEAFAFDPERVVRFEREAKAVPDDQSRRRLGSDRRATSRIVVQHFEEELKARVPIP